MFLQETAHKPGKGKHYKLFISPCLRFRNPLRQIGSFYRSIAFLIYPPRSNMLTEIRLLNN